MNFTNYQIAADNLPSSEELNYEPLEERYKKVMYFQYSLSWLIPAIVSLVFSFIILENRWWLLAASAFFVIACGIQLLFINRILSFRGYALREKDISQKKGIIMHRYTTIPLNRIQHISVNQGLVARKLDLASLEIYTASGTEKPITIKGLSKERAHEIKKFILSFVNEYEDN